MENNVKKNRKQEILNEEQKNLEYAQDLINTKIKLLETTINTRNSTIKEKLDYVATEKMDDLEKAEVYSDIYMDEGSLIAAQKEQTFLNRIKSKPFFAKIMFEKDKNNFNYYVGVKSILDKNNTPLILDWRSPVCSLLYFSSLGKTSFISPNGKTDVNLLLKRQFKLEPNKIVAYFDTNAKIDDNILQDILSKNTTNSMSNIVQTIQEEQNAIIRKAPNSSVIINGVAGSGKTSIAMHRLAYILFNSRGNITNENIMLISPNKLFSTYVKDVLPELGEENVPTYTIEELFLELNLIPKKYGTKRDMINSIFINLEREKEINYKFFQKFKKDVDDFIQTIDVKPYIKLIMETDMQVNEKLLFSIKPFYNLDIATRIEVIIETYLKNAYAKLSMGKIDNLTKKYSKLCKNLITPLNILNQIYKKHNLHNVENQNLQYEDISIYAYINLKLKNADKNYFIKHIFIDEMQDYDIFTISMLKEMYPDAHFTLTGDYNQNIISENSNLESLKLLFPNTNIDMLDISYRTTHEIITFSKKIVGDNSTPKNIIRHGDNPVINYCPKNDNVRTFINSIIDKYPNDKVAIIAKTEAEAINLSKLLTNFKLVINDEDDSILTSNKIITTTYLSKGLEYDRVIIPNVDDSNYKTSLDKQNLFVASTRALHGLYLYYSNSKSNFIKFYD